MTVKKTTKLVLTVFATVLFCGYNLTVQAAPIEILFTASTDNLTQAEVNAKLSEYNANELKANGFIAIIDGAIEVIGERAFSADNPLNQNLVGVIAPNVATLANFAFAECTALTTVDAPNVNGIGTGVFLNCASLTSVWFPEASFLSDGAFSNSGLTSAIFPKVWMVRAGAFMNCADLISVELPIVTIIEDVAFIGCYNLTSVVLGTGFDTPTEIKFWNGVFGGRSPNETVLTPNIDLTLGDYVWPLPNLTNRTWQTRSGNPGGTPYVWKSIDYTSILETVKNLQVSIYPNPTVETATVSFDLETAGNLTVTLTNILGQELFEIYSGFANAGTFTQTFSMEALPMACIT